MAYFGGGGLAYAANQLFIRKIEGDNLRRGVQVATAVAGGIFLGGKFGAAFAGASLFPLFSEIALSNGWLTTEGVSIDELSADLENAMDSLQLEADLGADLDELSFVDDMEELEVW